MTMNTMTSLLYTTVILCVAACAGSFPAPSRIFMSARVSSSAVLPCDCRNVSTQSPHVEWKTISETVFERRGGDLYQGEGYEDRVDVPEDHLLKGDCSLELKNIRPDDAGVYESYLLVRRNKRSLRSQRVFLQSVELSVDETPEEDFSDRVAVADEAGMTSHYPQIIALSLLSSSLFHLF
ncbi:versican core protein-like [Colossoma macropomum]|uniref:versican core protein-like n=1 Tax=Colossoma macropomum TaxID=42526 RepID=UPI001864C206|nr:versican core protein-like [Colossoma macropomum]XP_036419189.1 versican core protein-like [Colossoma macropomum]